MQAVLNLKMETFAQRVKKRREDLGLNQSTVAKIAGLKQPDISKIELGRIQQTTEILGLAKALQCNPEWLSTGDGDMVSESNRHPSRTDRPQVASNIATLEQITEALAGYLMSMDDDARDDAGDILRKLAHKPENHARAAAMLGAAKTKGRVVMADKIYHLPERRAIPRSGEIGMRNGTGQVLYGCFKPSTLYQ